MKLEFNSRLDLCEQVSPLQMLSSLEAHLHLDSPSKSLGEGGSVGVSTLDLEVS